MKRMETYQNDEQAENEAESPGEYPPGAKAQTVPAQGPGFQPVRKPVPPGQRGNEARAALALKALLASMQKAARTPPTTRRPRTPASIKPRGG